MSKNRASRTNICIPYSPLETDSETHPEAPILAAVDPHHLAEGLLQDAPIPEGAPVTTVMASTMPTPLETETLRRRLTMVDLD